MGSHEDLTTALLLASPSPPRGGRVLDSCDLLPTHCLPFPAFFWELDPDSPLGKHPFPSKCFPWVNPHPSPLTGMP